VEAEGIAGEESSGESQINKQKGQERVEQRGEYNV
jgi:hypothetical protein